MLTWDYYPNEFEINVLGGASMAARHGEKTYTCKSKQLIRFYFFQRSGMRRQRKVQGGGTKQFVLDSAAATDWQ